ARLVIDIDRRPPVALEDVAGHVSQGNNGAPGDVNAFDRALVEMPANDGVAGSVVRIFSDPARAEYPAVADFQESTFEMVSHVIPPVRAPCVVQHVPLTHAAASFQQSGCKHDLPDHSLMRAKLVRS